MTLGAEPAPGAAGPEGPARRPRPSAQLLPAPQGHQQGSASHSTNRGTEAQSRIWYTAGLQTPKPHSEPPRATAPRVSELPARVTVPPARFVAVDVNRIIAAHGCVRVGVCVSVRVCVCAWCARVCECECVSVYVRACGVCVGACVCECVCERAGGRECAVRMCVVYAGVCECAWACVSARASVGVSVRECGGRSHPHALPSLPPH